MVSTEPQNETVTMGGGRFAATHWSVVLAAASEDSQEAAAALEALCRQYWYPLYAFVCRLGHAPADAEDIVQSFFASLLEKRSLQHADPARGRFRTFLLASLKHFMAKQWQRQRTAKRGGGVPAFSLDELRPEELYARETAHALTPEQLYDRAWALRVLACVRERLRDDYARRGQAERFRLLESFLPGETSELTYAEAGRQLGLSEGSVKAEVHRLKGRYRSFLRAAVMPTVARLEDVDEELRELTGALSQ
jgi:RNA polymerase sigma-70 factor (ECF subfamily)